MDTMARHTRKICAVILALASATALRAVAQNSAQQPAAQQPAGAESAAPATQPAMPAPAAVVPVDLNSPRGAMKTLVLAISKGDSDGIHKVIFASSPTEQKMVDALGHRSSADANFRTAAIKAFGDPAKALVGDAEKLNAESMTQIDASKEKVDGEAATVDAGDGSQGEPVKLKKINGNWQIPATEFTRDGSEHELMQQIDDINFQADLMTQYAGDVAAGKYKTVDEAGEEIKKQMTVAMMKRSAMQTAPATGPSTKPAAPDNGAK